MQVYYQPRIVMGAPLQMNNSQMMGPMSTGLAGGGGGDPMMSIQGLGLGQGLPQYRNLQQQQQQQYQQQQQQQQYYGGAPNVGLVGQVMAPVGLYQEAYSSGKSGATSKKLCEGSCLVCTLLVTDSFPASPCEGDGAGVDHSLEAYGGSSSDQGMASQQQVSSPTFRLDTSRLPF